MSTVKMSLAVCATVLLVAGLGGKSGDAGIVFPGIFSGYKSLGRSYRLLADHLYTATQSARLADNTRAAGSLPSVHPDSKEDAVELAQAFGSLTGDSSDTERFCGKANLANLRRATEGLRDGGNLGPQEITPAILRLNTILLELIREARLVCAPYLARKWPRPWQPKFSDPAMRQLIVNLQAVAYSYLYEGFVGPSDSRTFSPAWQTGSISRVLKEDVDQAATLIELDYVNPLSTKNAVLIAKQLDAYIYKPCAQFVQLDEAKEVLEPFNGMLASWYAVTSQQLAGFYENGGVSRPSLASDEYDERVRELASSYRACQRLLAVPREDLAKKIREHRVDDDDDRVRTIRSA